MSKESAFNWLILTRSTSVNMQKILWRVNYFLPFVWCIFQFLGPFLVHFLISLPLFGAFSYFLAFVWCMKVSKESSRAYMKFVWWTGDWVPAHGHFSFRNKIYLFISFTNHRWFVLQVYNTCDFGGVALVSVGEDVHILVVVPRPAGAELVCVCVTTGP